MVIETSVIVAILFGETEAEAIDASPLLIARQLYPLDC